jgi:hypothetical protein
MLAQQHRKNHIKSMFETFASPANLICGHTNFLNIHREQTQDPPVSEKSQPGIVVATFAGLTAWSFSSQLF